MNQRWQNNVVQPRAALSASGVVSDSQCNCGGACGQPPAMTHLFQKLVLPKDAYVRPLPHNHCQPLRISVNKPNQLMSRRAKGTGKHPPVPAAAPHPIMLRRCCHGTAPSWLAPEV